MKLRTVFLVATLVGLTMAPTPLAGAATSTPRFLHATVTAAARGGNTEITLAIVNTTSRPIEITSITSPSATSGMLENDPSVLSPQHAMSWLGNILVLPGQTHALSYHGDGAMLSGLHASATVGHRFPLVIHWTNFQPASHVTTISARVVAAPKGLVFKMQGM